MSVTIDDLAPPVQLALAYAPKQVRAAWELVLQFDTRFAGVVGATSEPLIGQMKLAWWRDAIGTASATRPRGEPLLSVLSDLDDGVLKTAVASLVDAWETLIVTENWTTPVVKRFASERGLAIFGAYAALCGLPDFPEAVAQQWAADDLRLRFGSRVPQDIIASVALPKDRASRPLTILAMSVRNVSGTRLVWHALTGR